MTESSITISLFLVLFLIRILPRLIDPELTITTDVYMHLLHAEQIRLNKHKIPNWVKGFLLPSRFDYPYLFAFIISLFPKKAINNVEKVIGATIDLIHAILLYFFIKWYFAGLDLPYNVSVVFLAQTSVGLFAILPIFVSKAAGPRAFYLTPRPFGELLYSLVIFTSVYYYGTGSLVALSLACVFTGFVYVGTKFGVQAILFIFPIASLILWRWELMLILTAGFIVALIITKGRYLQVLQGHIRHSIYFKKYIINALAVTTSRNRSKDLVALPRLLLTNPKEFFITLWAKNTFTLLLIKNPTVIGVIIFWIVEPKDVFFELLHLNAFIIASFVVFVLTSLPPLLFLGEAERYVEFNLAANLSLFSLYVLAGNNTTTLVVLTGVFAYSLILYLFTLISFYRGTKKPKLDTRKMESFLKVYPREINFALIPSKLGFRFRYLIGRHNYLYMGSNLNERFISLEQVVKTFPKDIFIPTTDLNFLMETYNINGIICFKPFNKRVEELKYKYNFNGWKLEYQDDNFLIYIKTENS